jgi:hypothetical protein
MHRVDPDFGSTLTVSNMDSQSNCWVNLRILSQPCEFYLRGPRAHCAQSSARARGEIRGAPPPVRHRGRATAGCASACARVSARRWPYTTPCHGASIILRLTKGATRPTHHTRQPQRSRVGSSASGRKGGKSSPVQRSPSPSAVPSTTPVLGWTIRWWLCACECRLIPVYTIWP